MSSSHEPVIWRRCVFNEKPSSWLISLSSTEIFSLSNSTILAQSWQMMWLWFGMLRVIRVVKLVVLAEIHLVDQSALSEEGKRPVNRRARDGSVAFTGPFQELLSREVLFGREDGLHNRLPLRGDAQILPGEEIQEFLFGCDFLRGRHGTSIFQGAIKSTRERRSNSHYRGRAGPLGQPERARVDHEPPRQAGRAVPPYPKLELLAGAQQFSLSR